MATWKYWDEDGEHEWADKDERLPAGTLLFKKDFLQQFVDASNERSSLWYNLLWANNAFSLALSDTYEGDPSWCSASDIFYPEDRKSMLNEMLYRMQESVEGTGRSGNLEGGGSCYPTTWEPLASLTAPTPAKWTAALMAGEVSLVTAADGDWHFFDRVMPIQIYDLSNGFGYQKRYGRLLPGEHVGYWSFGMFRQVFSRIGTRYRHLYWEEFDPDTLVQARSVTHTSDGPSLPATYAGFVAAYLASPIGTSHGINAKSGCTNIAAWLGTPTSHSPLFIANVLQIYPAWPYMLTNRRFKWNLFRKTELTDMNPYGSSNSYDAWDGASVIQDQYALIDSGDESNQAKHIPDGGYDYSDINAAPPDILPAFPGNHASGYSGADFQGILCMAIDWEYQ